MTLKTERKKISPDGGKPVVPIIAQSFKVFPPHARKNADIDYAESDSDLGDDEERILMHDDHNIPSNYEDVDDMDDDKSTPK